MLYGAIAGDIAGSIFEYQGIRGDEESFFASESEATDDSILTLAVADTIISGIDFADALIRYAILYNDPMGGYGTGFILWCAKGPGAPAYNSCGNGSAMRVSPCGWVKDTLEETLDLARRSAECTHNHPEGIKGAEATAACIFLARKGKTKEEIRNYVKEHYYADLLSYEEYYKEPYLFHDTCQGTVPRAIAAFLYSSDFENALRYSMLLDKDTDTVAAVTGAIAEAYYGVPQYIKDIVREKLDKPLLDVLDEFEQQFKTNEPTKK